MNYTAGLFSSRLEEAAHAAEMFSMQRVIFYKWHLLTFASSEQEPLLFLISNIMYTHIYSRDLHRR